MTTGVNYDGPQERDQRHCPTCTRLPTPCAAKASVRFSGRASRRPPKTVGPGPCENASCAITSLAGSGTNLSLSLTNQSGLDRLSTAGGSAATPAGGTGGGVLLRGVGSNRCLDVPTRSRPTGPCSISGTAAATPTSSGTTCRTVSCRSTAASASMSQPCHGRRHQGGHLGL